MLRVDLRGLRDKWPGTFELGFLQYAWIGADPRLDDEFIVRDADRRTIAVLRKTGSSSIHSEVSDDHSLVHYTLTSETIAELSDHDKFLAFRNALTKALWEPCQ
jgi:vacuolar-type H+-ATPase subunit C/Vma6